MGKGFVLIHPFTSVYSQLQKLRFIASLDGREGAQSIGNIPPILSFITI